MKEVLKLEAQSATVMAAMSGGIRGGRVLTRGDASAPGTGLATPSGHWPGLEALD